MISKLLTKVKSEKDPSVRKGSGPLSKDKQDAGTGLFKSFFKKLQEEGSTSGKAGTKTASGEGDPSGRISKKDTVLGGKFSLAGSDGKAGDTDTKTGAITVNEDRHCPAPIVEDISESEKEEAGPKSDTNKTTEKEKASADASGKKEDISKAGKKKDAPKADSKNIAEQSVQPVGKEISNTKASDKEQSGNKKESIATDKESGKEGKEVASKTKNEKNTTAPVVKDGNKKQMLAGNKNADKKVGESGSSFKETLSGKDDPKTKGQDAETAKITDQDHKTEKAMVKSTKSEEGQSVSPNADPKSDKADARPDKDQQAKKAVADDNKKGDEKGNSDQKSAETEGGSIKKSQTARQPATAAKPPKAKSKQGPASAKSEVKKNRDDSNAIKRQPDASVHDQVVRDKTQDKPEASRPLKTDKHEVGKQLKPASADKKPAGHGKKRADAPGKFEKRFKISTKKAETAPVARERGNTSWKTDRRSFVRQQNRVANHFLQQKNGNEASLAGTAEKVAGQLTSQNAKEKKSERHHGRSRGRLPLSKHTSKNHMRSATFTGFTAKDNEDYGSEEQQFRWEQQDLISPEENEKGKMSKGTASSGFKLNQMPVANAFLRQRILPGLTRSIKNAAGTSRNGTKPGKWEKHNFVLDDGKNIHLSVRENKGVLQVKMGSLNVDLRKLLQQNIHQIKQHLKQEFGTNIDLQFSNSGEQQQSSEFFKESSHPRNSANTNRLSDGKVATQTAGRPKVHSVRNFGYNQMEWKA